MRFGALRFGVSLAAAVSLAIPASGQPLPDLGGTADTVLTPQAERRLGESIVRDIRRDPAYIDDPETADYLAGLAGQLGAVMPGARQDFEFFVLRDNSINAFALPGGFIGVHTGLIVSSETESELASVIGHEMGHVVNRHIARSIAQQQQWQGPVMLSLLAAVLLARSRPDLATGAAMGAQAGAVQSQLAYSRDFEREADRSGMDALAAAGFDPSAMPAFFERLQRSTRVGDDSSFPGYLRTHPLTSERIAAAQARVAALPYHQHVDAADFQYVRAKLRAGTGDPHDAVVSLENSVRDGRYVSEGAARYGLASALLRAGRPRDADAALARARKAGAQGAMLEGLAGRIRLALKDAPGAVRLLAEARTRYPHSRPLLYGYLEALDEAGHPQEALAALAEPVRLSPRDWHLREMQARAYAVLGKRASQHQAQAEAQALLGNLPAAIEQLQLARSAGDGDFYQLSVVDARLRELRAQHQQDVLDKR